MHVSFYTDTLRFLGITVLGPTLFWVVLTTLRIWLLPMLGIEDASMWARTIPFLLELMIPAIYCLLKVDELREMRSSQPHLSKFYAVRKEEARNAFHANTLYLAAAAPVTLFLVLLASRFFPSLPLYESAFVSGRAMLVALAVAIPWAVVMCRLAPEYGSSLPPSQSSHKTVAPPKAPLQGEGLSTQERAQEHWEKP